MPGKLLWSSCLNFFQETLTPQQFNSWIRPLVFEIQGNQITLTAPSGFALKLVQERFLPEITKQAELFLSAPANFNLRIAGQTASTAPPPSAAEVAPRESHQSAPHPLDVLQFESQGLWL